MVRIQENQVLVDVASVNGIAGGNDNVGHIEESSNNENSNHHCVISIDYKE